MAHIEIRSGLRKLEFDGPSSRALVEFACDEPLPRADEVRIELGRRDGVLREITGHPELIEARDERRGQHQYVYRLNAIIGKVALALAFVLIASTSLQALADPPAHAPAHGWRKKHDPYYVGYTGTKWERDYDVSSGRCNREEIGAVLGGVAGGVIGSRVDSPENRAVAIIIGAAAGALIGAKIGRELDEGDRGCFGHALEIGEPGRSVVWDNRASGVSYTLVPGAGQKSSAGTCRDFTLTAKRGLESTRRTGKACQSATGVWKIA